MPATQAVNWDDPESRLRFAEAVGPQAYNAALIAHVRRSTVAVVNGYHIRPVGSRFGRLFMINGTDRAFNQLEKAKTYAAGLPSLEGDAWETPISRADC